MPTLERIEFTRGADTLPWGPGPGMTVLDGGVVAVPGNFSPAGMSGGMVHLLAPDVDSLVSIARLGEAPGEVSNGVKLLQARGDTLLILDLGRYALLRYDASGRYLTQRRMSSSTRGAIMKVTSDSVDIMSLPRPELIKLAPGFVWRQPLEGDGHRVLLAASDSFVEAFLANRRQAQIPLAITPQRIALAEPWRYTVAVYDNDGRRLHVIDRPLTGPRRDSAEFQRARQNLLASLNEGGSPAQMRSYRDQLDTLAQEFLPHLEQNALHFDHRGRLWVIGRVADSTFADVYSDADFLGRLTVPCAKPGRHIALTNSKLALLCAETANDAVPWRLHLYSIVEPTPAQ